MCLGMFTNHYRKSFFGRNGWITRAYGTIKITPLCKYFSVVNRQVHHMGLSNESSIEECQHRLVFKNERCFVLYLRCQTNGRFRANKRSVGTHVVTKKVTLRRKNGACRACFKIKRLATSIWFTEIILKLLTSYGHYISLSVPSLAQRRRARSWLGSFDCHLHRSAIERKVQLHLWPND